MADFPLQQLSTSIDAQSSSDPARRRKISIQSAPKVHRHRLGSTSSAPRRPSFTEALADSPAVEGGSSRIRSDSNLMRGRSLSPDIIAPVPRRHLLSAHQSRLWMSEERSNFPPSPTSSRAASPASVQSNSKRVSSKKSALLSTASPRPSTADHTAHSTARLTHASKRNLSDAQDDRDEGLGRRAIRWGHRRGLKDWILIGIVILGVLVRLSIGLGSYSGKGTPPMYGDYEAQRHWMELTVHLPTREWYTYDLQYWGLDYPPLTAYVSWLCGKVGTWIQPKWFALDQSRGIETEESKLYMRLTVVVWDLLVYIPSLFLFKSRWLGTRSRRTQDLAFFVLMFQPALLLIDFGHFQYNSVMLGFTILALDFFATGQDEMGAIFFVLSLGFKQMALYYAPAIGTYLLSKCILLGPSSGTQLFTRLGATTTLAFIVLFLPFLPPLAPLSAISQPITRIFPFARGLFEDKVANFWCASNVVIKWKNLASPSLLVRVSTALTLLGFLPGTIVMLRSGWKLQERETAREDKPKSTPEPTPLLPLLPYTLLNSSMSFFLFSFQVHEKTILLPLMPITLLLSGAAQDSSVFAWGALVTNVAMFSMWPLLKKDELGIQYIALLLLWNRILGHNPFRYPVKSLVQVISIVVYIAATSLHILELIITPPARYPDLFAVLNVLISTPVFVLTWLWSIKCCVEVSWAIGGLGRSSGAASSRKEAPSVSNDSK